MLAHAEAGLNSYEIAKLHEVSHSSVHRFLERAEIEKGDTERYKSIRADLLSNTGAKLQSIIDRVLLSMSMDAENGVLDALDSTEKGKLTRDLAVVQGVLFDKERLERGESTANISTVSKMVDSSVSSLHKRNPLIVNESPSEPTSRS